MAAITLFEQLSNGDTVPIGSENPMIIDVETSPRKGEYFTYQQTTYRVVIVIHDIDKRVTGIIGVMSDANPEGKAH